MKILLIGPFPPPIDGCSNANKVLKRNLKLGAVSHSLINTNTNIITREQGSRFSIKKAFVFLKSYLTLYKIFGCDIIYVTPGQTFYGVAKYFPFILVCIILGKPYVIHLHGNYLGRQYEKLGGIKKKVFRFLISRASAAIVITKTLSKNFKNLLPANKIFVVEYFVENELYHVPLKKLSDKLRIIYLSNLMHEKGILEVLDALIVLNQKNISFEATIAGSMEVGIRDEVDKRLKVLGNNVKYIGVITGKEKTKKLMEANTFILPTYYRMEGLPFSILEAMATGNIIITTAHAGIPDIVSSDNGFVINPRSSAEIVTTVEKINDDLVGMVYKYSNYNRFYCSSHFTEDNYTKKIISILHATASTK